MKKHLCLLLCFLLLFCSACEKEKLPQAPQNDIPPEPEEEFVSELSADSFYTSDGYTYNTYFTVEITTKEPTAPITSLSFAFKNDSDYFAKDATCKWEKWEDGRWKSYTEYTEQYIRNKENEVVLMGYLSSPHNSIADAETFVTPLESGTYRLRIQYTLTNQKTQKDGWIFIPGIRCIAETYFTILPAPET